MRLSLVFAGTIALAACGSKEQPVAEATPTAVETTAAATAPGDMTGRYEITAADGTVVIEQINSDGSYVDTKEGLESEKGTWRADGAKMCFDPEGSDPETCYTSTAPGADGTFKVIGPDGKESGNTVRKIG